MKKWVKNAAAAAMLTMGLAGVGKAQTDPIRIGFITDMTGVYADIDGPGGVEAIRMAIEDAGGAISGRKVELLVADHQNKADIAAARAREWYDSGVDVIIGGTNSSAVLAINHVARQKKKVMLSSSAATTRLSNEECSPWSVQYVTDTTAIARVTGSAVVKDGGKSWYLISVDTAVGHSLEKDLVEVVKAGGGTIKGSIRHSLGTTDFSSMLLQAQSSGAQVVGLATGGGDLLAAIKGAQEFGLHRSMKVAAPLAFLSDIHALGLPVAQGLYYTEGWYWDHDEKSRAWAKRFFDKRKAMPTSYQAGNASVTNHWLSAVKAVGSTDADKVMEKMRATPINDFFTQNGTIRPDGRMVHDMFLMQVKSPAESKYPWDYSKLIGTVPGEKAFMSKAESKCAHWK
ncbi:MAG: ABC transporter permease [Burkholderiales bacterium 66-5]|uniref:ABC transporter substrate-binding protein n=1 Tax=Comamonas badia TaxID=265291 RepID=UPI0004269CC5|nr:ABC transporter substrate-binding protein [Comamonas badia]OJU91060.1 MAG: ABC transporter permease [Burkholderiales bacterium 66-5]